jgi:predicted O-methyltransferase YrrM
MRGSAISPDIAVILASFVLDRKPKIILELGSGVSTLIMAYCLRKIGAGHIQSLDHEERFAGTTRRNLELHGLADWATVCHAPLTTTQAGGETWQWYDLAVLDKGLRADLLFIDGPPRMLGPQSRYPALPLLVSHLTPSAVVVLDDAAREGERAVVQRWLSEYPGWECDRMAAEKGAVVLRRTA